MIHFGAISTIVHFSGSPLHLFPETPMNKEIQGEGSPVFYVFPSFTSFTLKDACLNSLIARNIESRCWTYRCSTLEI